MTAALFMVVLMAGHPLEKGGPRSSDELAPLAAKGDAEGIRAACRVHCEPNRRGGEALRQAALRGSVEAASTLLEYGADVNSADEDDKAPLYLAARGGYLQLVQLLVSRGARVNHCEMEYTPLRVAVRRQYLEVARYLLEHGAGPNATCSDPETALEIARRQKDEAMVHLLEQHGASDKPGESESFTVPSGLAGPVVVLLDLKKGIDVPRRGNTRAYSLPVSGVLSVDVWPFSEDVERHWISEATDGRKTPVNPCADVAELATARCVWGFTTGRKGQTDYMAFWMGPSPSISNRSSALDAAVAAAVRRARK